MQNNDIIIINDNTNNTIQVIKDVDNNSVIVEKDIKLFTDEINANNADSIIVNDTLIVKKIIKKDGTANEILLSNGDILNLNDITVDLTNYQTINSNLLETTDKNIVNAINEVNGIAKGAAKAIIKDNYSSLINYLSTTTDEINVGQNIYIKQLNIPDLWVSEINSISTTYNYTDDISFQNYLISGGYVGKYKLNFLETQKVDLTDYYQKNTIDNKISDLKNTKVEQNGGTTFHTNYWVTGTASTNNLTVTASTALFNANMVGSKIIINSEERIIASYISNTQITVNISFTQNYNSTSFSVYCYVTKIAWTGGEYCPIFYTQNGNQYFLKSYDRIIFGAKISNGQNDGHLNFDDLNALKLAGNANIIWSSQNATGNADNATADLGIKRESAGLLSIYDGVTATNYRDIKLRNLYTNENLSSELCPDINITKWSLDKGFTISNNTLIRSTGFSGGYAQPITPITIIAGKIYKVVINAGNGNTGNFYLKYQLGGVSRSIIVNSTKTDYIVALNSDNFKVWDVSNAEYITINSISIKEVTTNTGDATVNGNLIVNGTTNYNNPVHFGNFIGKPVAPVAINTNDTNGEALRIYRANNTDQYLALNCGDGSETIIKNNAEKPFRIKTTSNNYAIEIVTPNNTTSFNDNGIITNKIKLWSLSEYTDNSAAISAGLTVGQVYRTGDLLKIVH